MIQDKQILIRKPFNEQYTIIVDMESMLINAYLKSKTEIRYDFTVLSTNEDYIECRLIQLDINIKESNSDLIKEIGQVTAAFNRMFNELHLRLTHQGKVIEILNIDLILDKWRETKVDMEKAAAGNPDVGKLISLNDSVFTNTEKIKTAIQSNEFFACYFGYAYGVYFPSTKRIVGANIFNTANLEWNFLTECNSRVTNEHLQTVVVTTKANPRLPLNEGFCNAAYHQFKDQILVQPSNIKILQVEEKYIEFQTGKLQKSYIQKTEEVYLDKLYYNIKYTLLNDAEKKALEEKEMNTQSL